MTPFSLVFPERCPKCQSAGGWSLSWREAAYHYGSGFAGSHDSFEEERIDVVCRTCGWFYAMEPADAKVPA